MSRSVVDASTPAEMVLPSLRLALLASVLVGSAGPLVGPDAPIAALAAQPATARPAVFEGPVARAESCAPGDRPETGIQGEVPIADRESGRSAEGYQCNLELVGRYGRSEGFEGASFQATWFGECAYYATAPSTQSRRGVQVIDASDRAHPTFARNLTTPAMLDPWESLKVHEGRKLLAGVMLHTNPQTVFTGFAAPGWMDIYDVGEDCADPRLLASKPFAGLSHEGNWSQDGNTYYAASLFPGVVTAIDVRDAANPVALGNIFVENAIHGMGTSPDGNRLYLAYINDDAYLTGVVNPQAPAPLEDTYGEESRTDNNGLAIYDVSDYQSRRPNPQARLMGTVFWKDGQVGQHAIHVTRDGRPYVIFVDEFGNGGPRIIDVSDERSPVVVSKLKTEILMPENRDRFEEGRDYDGEHGGVLAGFAYNTHYCSVDRQLEPTILACSSFESGVRVFDIRDFSAPMEIAYYNPGGDGTLMPASFGGTTAGYTAAAPRIDAQRGEIWFTDMDAGVFVTRFADGVWPFSS